MGKTSKKSEHKHKKKHQHHRQQRASSSASSSSSASAKNGDEWQEATHEDSSNDIPGGAVIKGPTMPTAAELQQQISTVQETAPPVIFALEPFDFESLGSVRRENKQAIKKAQSTAEMEAIVRERELNPMMRGQLETEDSKRTESRSKVGDAGLEWHRRAFERCKQQSKDEQRPLNDIVAQRYGSMEKLMSLINEAEDLSTDRHHHHSKDQSSRSRKFLHPNVKDDRTSSSSHKHHHHHHHHGDKRSWKKATDEDEQSARKQARTDDDDKRPSSSTTTTVETQNDQDDEEEEKPVKKEDEMISEENLLELRKQLIRAELAGDDEMTEMLRQEIKHIDSLRGNPQHDVHPSGQPSSDPKILVMTTIDRYGVEKPVHDAHEPGRQREHGHVSKRDRRKLKKEMKKMRAADKDPEREGLSLTDLVEMERHSTTNAMSVLPSNRARASGQMTADRQLLASTRHLTGWSRIQALADQRKRQQTFEQCWLCIENLSKSFIFGLLDQWFLCAPPQQSLVDGHCFLVPVQHTSSRFHLDEDVLSELDTLKEQLSELFRKYYNQIPIFLETFKNPRLLPHMYIECIPVPIDQAELVSMYFRKALLECESMWATNKKIVELIDRRSRSLKNVIPKGMPYFCVEFPSDTSKKGIYGYAHVIEERGQFPLYFGREILGGLLHVDNPLLWMRPASKEPDEIVEKKCTYLKQLWKKNTTASIS